MEDCISVLFSGELNTQLKPSVQTLCFLSTSKEVFGLGNFFNLFKIYIK